MVIATVVLCGVDNVLAWLFATFPPSKVLPNWR